MAAPETEGHFHGNELIVTSEVWETDEAVNILSTTHTEAAITVTPSNSNVLDIPHIWIVDDLNDLGHVWSIDFAVNRVSLVFTPLSGTLSENQYDYKNNVGFHFEDTFDKYPPILGVTVDDEFSPVGFDPDLVRFDDDNIYINLKGSSCFDETVPEMGSCKNMLSPTGNNNFMYVNVEFYNVGEPSSYRITEIDALFDWGEENYPWYLYPHQESFYMQGYRTRYYPGNNIYIGVKNDTFYSYHATTKDMMDLGSLDYWLDRAGIN